MTRIDKPIAPRREAAPAEDREFKLKPRKVNPPVKKRTEPAAQIHRLLKKQNNMAKRLESIGLDVEYYRDPHVWETGIALRNYLEEIKRPEPPPGLATEFDRFLGLPGNKPRDKNR
jgi:hypothetical protein